MIKMNTLGHFVNTQDCRVIIPVLDEIDIISSREFTSYINSIPFKVSFVDSKSIDGSFMALKDHGFDVTSYDGQKSIYKAVLSIATKLTEEYIVVLPIDCTVKFTELANTHSKIVWGGFYKSYDKVNAPIRLYLFLQNFIRTKLFKNLVWTNVMFFKRDLFLSLNITEGFLEDVAISDKLKSISDPIILKGPAAASFRKYEKSFFKRLYINLKVMILYRLKLKNLKELKEIYSN